MGEGCEAVDLNVICTSHSARGYRADFVVEVLVACFGVREVLSGKERRGRHYLRTLENIGVWQKSMPYMNWVGGTEAEKMII